jgi:hypothetical protein
VKLATPLHLVLKLRMTGATPPLLQYAFNANRRTALPETQHFQKAEKQQQLNTESNPVNYSTMYYIIPVNTQHNHTPKVHNNTNYTVPFMAL